MDQGDGDSAALGCGSALAGGRLRHREQAAHQTPSLVLIQSEKLLGDNRAAAIIAHFGHDTALGAGEVQRLVEQGCKQCRRFGHGCDVACHAQQGLAPAVHGDDPLGGNHACPQILHVEGFGQIVVGTGFAASEVMLLVTQRSQQNEVGVRRIALAHPATQLGSFEAWHQPVTDDHLGALLVEQCPGFLAIARNDRGVALALDQVVQQLADADVIFGDEHAHTVPQSTRRCVRRRRDR